MVKYNLRAEYSPFKIHKSLKHYTRLNCLAFIRKKVFLKITAILENSKLDKNLTARHGLSLYIETEQMNIIFDLGPDHSYIKNAQALGIDLNKANAVIISHGHSDHIGGLSYLDEVNKHAPIYLSSNALESHWIKIGLYYHNVGAKDTIKHFDNRLK